MNLHQLATHAVGAGKINVIDNAVWAFALFREGLLVAGTLKVTGLVDTGPVFLLAIIDEASTFWR